MTTCSCLIYLCMFINHQPRRCQFTLNPPPHTKDGNLLSRHTHTLKKIPHSEAPKKAGLPGRQDEETNRSSP